jgi:hypothetical protein
MSGYILDTNIFNRLRDWLLDRQALAGLTLKLTEYARRRIAGSHL